MRMWPPLTAWYSSDSAQLTSSGPKRGTVTAIVPPGRSTRASSPIAARSSGRCSRTSEQMTRSNVASGNGRCSPSPWTVPTRASSRVELARRRPSRRTSSRRPRPRRGPRRGRRRRRRGAPPRRRGGRSRSRGRAARSPRYEAEPVVVAGEHQANVHRRRAAAAREDRVVAGGRPARGHLPGEPLHHPLAARRAEPRAQRRVVEQRADRAPPAPRGRRGRRARPVRPDVADDLGQRAARRRHDRARRSSSPRWPAARSPRRATGTTATSASA